MVDGPTVKKNEGGEDSSVNLSYSCCNEQCKIIIVHIIQINLHTDKCAWFLWLSGIHLGEKGGGGGGGRRGLNPPIHIPTKN